MIPCIVLEKNSIISDNNFTRTVTKGHECLNKRCASFSIDLLVKSSREYPANIYLFQVNNRNAKKRFEIMFKVNNNDIRTTSLTSFWCFF